MTFAVPARERPKPRTAPDDARLAVGVEVRTQTVAAALAKRGILTAGDLLETPPRAWRDYSEGVTALGDVVVGAEATVRVELISVHVRPTRRRNLRIVEAAVRDDSGAGTAIWFNQGFLARTLLPGQLLQLRATDVGNAEACHDRMPPRDIKIGADMATPPGLNSSPRAAGCGVGWNPARCGYPPGRLLFSGARTRRSEDLTPNGSKAVIYRSIKRRSEVSVDGTWIFHKEADCGGACCAGPAARRHPCRCFAGASRNFRRMSTACQQADHRSAHARRARIRFPELHEGGAKRAFPRLPPTAGRQEAVGRRFVPELRARQRKVVCCRRSSAA